MRAKDQLKPRGKVEIFTTKGPAAIVTPIDYQFTNQFGQKIYRDIDIDCSHTKLINHQVLENIIFNQGKDIVISSLTTGFVKTIARMAIGDRGTIPSDQTVPKVPTPDMTSLYNEVFRSDIDVTALDVGTPANHKVKFTKTFSALTIPITSFSNQANPVVNEVSLIVADLLGGAPLPRADVAAPVSPDADEEAFSMRAMKSVPFEAANEISITFRYTIFIE